MMWKQPRGEQLFLEIKKQLYQLLQFNPILKSKLPNKENPYCQWQFNICEVCPAILSWKWKVTAEQLTNYESWKDLAAKFQEEQFVWQLRRLVKQHQQNECFAKVL